MKNKKDKRDSQEERQDRVTIEGIVMEALPSAMFSVEVAGNTVMTRLSGRLRQNNIKILPGDKVKIEVSPYNLNLGRIVWRF